MNAFINQTYQNKFTVRLQDVEVVLATLNFDFIGNDRRLSCILVTEQWQM